MPGTILNHAPSLSSFLKSLRTREVEACIELLSSLLKRRQIRNPRPCAIATAELLRRVVSTFRGKSVGELLERIRHVGRRLVAAQPREMAVGNIVRRVLGLIREIVEQKDEEDASNAGTPMTQSQELPARPKFHSSISTLSPLKHGAVQPTNPNPNVNESGTAPAPAARRPPLLTSHTSFAPTGAPTVTSLFGLFSQVSNSATSTPPQFNSPSSKGPTSFADKLFRVDNASQAANIKVDVLEGIREILDELEIVDEQIAEFALDNIHEGEVILTHTSSLTIQHFLTKAAKKRKFTVIHVEGYPNDEKSTYDAILNGGRKDLLPFADADTGESNRFKPLIDMGIKVILIPDSAVFAIMSRVNKVILATHSVLANGGLVAAAGAKLIAQAARAHQTPVVVLSGIYKLSPIYPFDVEELIEWGDAGKVVQYADPDFVKNVEVVNPIYDYVEPALVDLYISNLGSHAPSYLYHVVAEHYHQEDINI